MLLAVAGISAASVQWFSWLEPVLLPAGYLLLTAAIFTRARDTEPPTAPGARVTA